MAMKPLLDFYRVVFKIISGNIIEAQVQDISIDGEDQFLSWTPEFQIISRGSRSLQNIEWSNVSNCEYDPNDSILYVDDTEFQIDRECAELLYFVPDFKVDYDTTFDNLMKHFCEAVRARKIL